jgi:hypothetical protein
MAEIKVYLRTPRTGPINATINGPEWSGAKSLGIRTHEGVALSPRDILQYAGDNMFYRVVEGLGDGEYVAYRCLSPISNDRVVVDITAYGVA